MGRKIKIMYWLTDSVHSRVFEPFTEDRRFEQIMIRHEAAKRIHNIKINNIKQYRYGRIIRAINKFKPDVFVQTEGRVIVREHLKENDIKHVYLMHGLWLPKSPKSHDMASNPFWTNYDLLCGGTKRFKDLFDEKVHAKIIINAVPQFDVLYDHIQRRHKIREKLLQKSKVPDAQKIITLFGHNIKNKKNLVPYHQDYFRSVNKLASLAKKYNWLLCIKTKAPWLRGYTYLKNNAKKHNWAKELYKQHAGVEKEKNVMIIGEHGDQYDLFCSDVIISTARSTTEIETILANKPLIRVCAIRNETTEKYENGILDNGVAYIVDSVDRLEETVNLAMSEDNNEIKQNRSRFITDLGLTCDGNAHKRVFNAILNLCGDLV